MNEWNTYLVDGSLPPSLDAAEHTGDWNTFLFGLGAGVDKHFATRFFP
jgi:purine nucleoside permease